MSTNLSAQPLPPEFDAYLAHASEDKPFVRLLARGLEKRGWNVWLDELQLLVGLSIRSQLDAGLHSSRYGLVILSPAFFAKRWPREELDAMFSLERDGRTRILPIWHDVTEDEVVRFSPILASRFAAIDNGDIDSLAGQLSQTMEVLNEHNWSYWSDIVRSATAKGLLWVQPPEPFPGSLRLLDQHFHTFWAGRDGGKVEVAQEFAMASLPELFDNAPSYDGRIVGTIGHQGAQQLLRVTRYDDYALNEYVVQVKSGMPGYQHHLLYVRLAELTNEAPIIPTPPSAHLVFLTGVVTARGALTVSDGQTYSGLYMVAARLAYIPRYKE